MKRKHFLCVFLMMACMMMLISSNALAEGRGEDCSIAINLLGKKKTFNICSYSEKELKGVSSSNKKVLSVTKKLKGKNYIVSARVLKTGKVKVRFKTTYDDFYNTYNVFKYSNPFKSLKIGKKNYASKFKKKFKYGKVPNNTSGKLSYKLNKGWTVKSIIYGGPTVLKEHAEELYESGDDGIQVKKGDTVKLAKGDYIAFVFKQNRTGAYVTIVLASGKKMTSDFKTGDGWI